MILLKIMTGKMVVTIGMTGKKTLLQIEFKNRNYSWNDNAFSQKHRMFLQLGHPKELAKWNELPLISFSYLWLCLFQCTNSCVYRN